LLHGIGTNGKLIMFKVNAILPTNNESDILEECLEAASIWADNIYVFDTGSTDETWSIVKRIALKNPKVIPYLSEYRPYNFTKTLSEVFAYYFHMSQPGDWWCTLCTDEQYIDDPRLFLAKLADSYDCVWSTALQYYFTKSDLEIYKESTLSQRQMTKHSERLKWYRNNYSEVRFYKHGLNTKQNTLFEQKNFSRVSPVRIALKHFQYRTPEQIVRRVRARQAIFDGDPLMQFTHEMHFELDQDGKPRVDLPASLKLKSNELSDTQILNLRIVPEDLLHQDLKDGRFKFEPDLLPHMPIRLYEPIEMLRLSIISRIEIIIIRIRNLVAFIFIKFRDF